MDFLRKIGVLLIEDDEGDARLIAEYLAEANLARFDIEWVRSLEEALDYLSENCPCVVLLDLALPDAAGLDGLVKIRSRYPDIPVVILTGLKDDELAVMSVRRGAQDFLYKGDLNTGLLERAILYAMERQKMLIELRALSLLDELTGLYNRRGFIALASQNIELARRENRGLVLLYCDFDGLKAINDTFGHSLGDIALVDTANILKRTFRPSDILARVGGDEFAVLAVGVEEKDQPLLVRKIEDNVRRYNLSGALGFDISLSIGSAYFDPQNPCTLEELIDRADRAMYEAKARKK